MKTVLVTGGCGYCGSVLVPHMLRHGYRVVVLDTMWFGNALEPDHNLTVLTGSILDRIHLLTAVRGVDAIIHLAGVANDPCGELNPKLTWETNALGTLLLAQEAASEGVEQFIYASSGSVYGIKGDTAVKETEPLVPITEYNKAKMVAERCLLSFQDQMAVQIVRPGTVCGASPRQRLDISVNGMVVTAFHEKEIRVQGRGLKRANVNIHDLVRVYMWMLERPNVTGIFNAAFENVSLEDIAYTVRRHTNAAIVDIPVKDSRTYRIDSSKLTSMGFVPNYCIENAVEELVYACEDGVLFNEDKHYNLRSMPKQ